MVFDDILGGFVTLFSDPYAIWFVFLAAFVGIVSVIGSKRFYMTVHIIGMKNRYFTCF